MAIKAGIKVLPKDLTEVVPILVDKKIVKGSKKVDMVWVEDDVGFINHLIKDYYQDLRIDIYPEPDSFMEYVEQYPLDTRIILDTSYLDSNRVPYELGGRDIARKLYKMGYTNMVIFSGETGATTQKDPGMITIVSKDDKESSKILDKI